MAKARDIAQAWRNKVREGIDPTEEARQAKAAVARAEAAVLAEAQRVTGTAFKAVAEVYINDHVSKLAHWNEVASMVRYLASQIGATPIAEVTAAACEGAIKAAKARAAGHATGTDGSGSARRHFQVLKHLFTWAMRTPAYQDQGLLANPMDRLDSGQTAGKAVQRSRILTDRELAAVWQGAETMGYPVRQIDPRADPEWPAPRRVVKDAVVRSGPRQKADRHTRRTNEAGTRAHRADGAYDV